MADSLLKLLMQSAGSGAESAGRAIGSGFSSAIDEMDLLASGFAEESFGWRDRENRGEHNLPPPPQKLGDAGPYKDPEMGRKYNSQQLENIMQIMGSPVRAIDRASETYFGRPAILSSVEDYERELSAPRAVERVFAGVSDEEERKATAKRTSAEGSLLEKRSRAMDMEAKMIQDRLKSLKGKSRADDADTFVSGPFEGYVRGGERSEPSRGTFSRSNKPIASYGAEQLSAEDAQSLGVPSAMSEIIQRIGAAKSPQQMKALEILAQSIPERRTPQQEDESLLQDLMKSKDPLSALPITQAILRRRGRSDEYINALFNGADILTPK